MKNKIFKNIIVLLGLLYLSACSNYLDINVSPNSPAEVSNLNLILSDVIHTTSYNLVGGGNFSRASSQWIQHTTDATTPGGRLDDYVFNTSAFNNEWEFTSYTSILANCKIVIEEGTKRQLWRQVAIAQILMAQNYAALTDYFGDIPFSEALKRLENLSPKYDTQEAVYTGIQKLLDDAIANIDKPIPAGINFGTGDFIFGASGGTTANAGTNQMIRWKKFANTLKARYHLRLSNAPGKTASAQADLAIAALANGISSVAENARFAYLGGAGQEAPWNQWVAKFSQSHVISKTLMDALKAKTDPRLSIYAVPAVNAATQPFPNNYVGQANGANPPTNLANVSAIGAYFLAAAESVYLASYEEALFLRAEAEFYKNGLAAAQPFYNQAITAHINKISGGTITNTQITDYLALNPMNGLEDLVVQKWIASYIHAPQEAYHYFRKTGFPILTPVSSASPNNPNIPTRIPYSDTEILNNKTNVPTNVTQNSKVWWDAN